MRQSVIRHVFANTCAIGWLPPDLDVNSLAGRRGDAARPVTGIPMEIVGTGFLIGPQHVLTCAHVLYGMGRKGIRASQVICAFVISFDNDSSSEIIFRWNFKPSDLVPLRAEVPSDKPHVTPPEDCAVIRLGPDLDWPKQTGPMPGLTPAHPDSIYLGQPIVISGYFMANRLLDLKGAAQARFGPLILHGHLAAIGPAAPTWRESTADFLLDIAAQPGLSGAPVCDEEGRVFAMFTGGVERNLNYPDGAEIPNGPRPTYSVGLGRAVPLYAQAVPGMIEAADSAARSAEGLSDAGPAG